jgi:hypothetical protein
MDSNLVTQLGVGGIFAILIVKMVLEFLAKKKLNGSATSTRDMFDLLRQIKDVNVILKNALVELTPLIRQSCERVAELHKWHDREDDDGVKVWYLRSHLEESIKSLDDGVREFTKATCRMNELLEQSSSRDSNRGG